MWSCAPPGRGGLGDVAEAFGEEVAHTYWAPIKTMLDAGINVSLEGADNFWGEIQLLITRKDRDGKVWGAPERVDRETALRIATRTGPITSSRGTSSALSRPESSPIYSSWIVTT